ncbi:hypothetical protein AABB24_024909 [Solanum stoloniferum]|uniref:F-box domain-containing protein n=1 Tax=Solanum stoloniferum TaxID=62892 RepID=A0ABD2SQP4_9SOLN
MGQPNNIPVEEEANGGQGNEFHPAGQMVQPNNIPVGSMADQNNNEEEDYAVINCNLPKDAVERILVGLPVRSLLQPKSVCKSWYNFIKSRNFIKIYCNHQIPCPPPPSRISKAITSRKTT